MAGLQTIILAFRQISFAPQRWQHGRLSWRRHSSSQPSAKHGPRNKVPRTVSTLTPEKMVLAGQEIINFSNVTGFKLTTRKGKVRLMFEHNTPFPPQTAGVLYFDHIPGSYLKSQIRIRLCESVNHFVRGSDLLAKGDQPWSIDVYRMKAAPSSYQPLLDIIKEEFGDVPDVEDNRYVKTLSPEEMVSAGQAIINVSGQETFLCHIPPRRPQSKFRYHPSHPFPQNTRGVLYLALDNAELRFRLCSTVEDFHAGLDLLLPNGNPWGCRRKRRILSQMDSITKTKAFSREFASNKNWICTLVPQNIVSSGQKIINAHSTTSIGVWVFDQDASGGPIPHRAQIRGFSREKAYNGVFYYHHVPGDDEQSQLRFRQCSTTAEFANGEDAIGDTGGTWNWPLRRMRSGLDTYQPILKLIGGEYDLFDSGTASPKIKNRILTLSPQNIISSRRKVIGTRPTSDVALWVVNRDASGRPILRRSRIRRFVKSYSRGVFYYHHVPGDDEQSQLRFRLCSTTTDFAEGEDAKGRTGKIWNRPLSKLRSDSNYHPILNLVREEYGLLKSGMGAPKSNHPLMPIISLAPRTFIRLKQQILDISGLRDVFLNAAPTMQGRRKKRISVDSTSGKDSSDCIPFPPNTVGVFYYKQSLTSPTQIGELRFRLCRDLAFFDHSEDLTFPTGDPWYIDVQQLYLNERYRALRDILFREGHAEQNPDLEDPIEPQLRSQEDALIVPNLSQPFSLELSREQHKFWVRADGNKWVMLKIKGLFSPQKQSNNAYIGRVVARFEPYPQNSPSNIKQQQPLLALRFLEILAPIQRISDDDFMKRPVPGQLHMVCRPGVDGAYRPWGFRNSDAENRKTVLGLLKSASVKKS